MQPVSVHVAAPVQVVFQLLEPVSVPVAADYEASHHKMTLMVAYYEHEGTPEYAGKAAEPSPVQGQHK